MDHESLRRKYRIELETPRLLLRPLVAEDVDWLAVLYLDAEVNRYLWECAKCETEANRWARAVVELDFNQCWFGLWVVTQKETGAVHGWAELSKLRHWSGPSDEIALSYVLGRAAWGRGIATEAAARLLQHAFEVHRLDRVMAITMAENAASKRVLVKLGMRPVKGPEFADETLEYFRIDGPTARES